MPLPKSNDKPSVTTHRLYTFIDEMSPVRTPWFYNIITEFNNTTSLNRINSYKKWEEWNRRMAKEYNATYNVWEQYYEFTDERDVTFFY